MKTIAIITARGGSKRIPGKNIKPFLGKPILAYSIEAAFQSGAFDEVMVSTDDEEIARIARQYGAKVPFLRSDATSGDFATTNDVLEEVLGEYEKCGASYDLACCLYPTAPFVTAEKLQKAMEALKASDCDALVPVVPFSFPPKRGFTIRDGKLFYEYPEYVSVRSQDIPTSYHDAGQFYFFWVSNMKENGGFLKGKLLPFVLSEMEVQDIDNQTDWELAECKYQLLHKKTTP